MDNKSYFTKSQENGFIFGRDKSQKDLELDRMLSVKHLEMFYFKL